MAKQKEKKLLARLKIVEAIPKTGEAGQERPILEKFLKMRGVKYKSLSVKNTYRGENLKNDFLDHLFAICSTSCCLDGPECWNFQMMNTVISEEERHPYALLSISTYFREPKHLI